MGESSVAESPPASASIHIRSQAQGERREGRRSWDRLGLSQRAVSQSVGRSVGMQGAQKRNPVESFWRRMLSSPPGPHRNALQMWMLSSMQCDMMGDNKRKGHKYTNSCNTNGTRSLLICKIFKEILFITKITHCLLIYLCLASKQSFLNYLWFGLPQDCWSPQRLLFLFLPFSLRFNLLTVETHILKKLWCWTSVCFALIIIKALAGIDVLQMHPVCIAKRECEKCWGDVLQRQFCVCVSVYAVCYQIRFFLTEPLWLDWGLWPLRFSD